MSVELMSLVMKADLGTVAYLVPATDKSPEKRGHLGTFDKHLLMVLADRGNPDGRSIYPSVEWMAKAMSATDRAVHISLLRLKGTVPQILVVEQGQVSRYSTLHYRIMVSALECVPQWKLRVDDQAGVNDVQPSGSRGEPGSRRAEPHSLRGELSSSEPPVEAPVEPPVEQHPAPNGAGERAQAAQEPLLVEAEAVEGHPDAAAPPARRGHPAISLFFDRWKTQYGKAPTINSKRIGILTQIYKGLGTEALEEYPRLLDALFNSTDRFIVDNAHIPEVFQVKLDSLRVNGAGSPRSVLGKHGEVTVRNGKAWMRNKLAADGAQP